MKTPRPKKQTYWVMMKTSDASLIVVGYDPQDYMPYYYEWNKNSVSINDDAYQWGQLWGAVEHGLVECLGEL